MTVNLTLICPAAEAYLARSICETISPENYGGMFRTPCGPDSTTITHYITSGPCSDGFAALAPCATWEQQGDPPEWVMTDYYPGDPITTANLCRAAEPPLEVTDDEVEALYAELDVSQQDPFVALGRLGLVLYQEPVQAGPAGADGASE